MYTRIQSLSQFNQLVRNEKSILAQTATCEWLRHGDSNSKIFHSTIKWRRMKNEIKGINIQGYWCEKTFKVKFAVHDYFEEDRFCGRGKNSLIYLRIIIAC